MTYHLIEFFLSFLFPGNLIFFVLNNRQPLSTREDFVGCFPCNASDDKKDEKKLKRIEVNFHFQLGEVDELLDFNL